LKESGLPSYAFRINHQINSQNNHCTMKKVLAILAVAGVFAACNNGKEETTKTDSVKTDSVTTAPAPTVVDSSKMDSSKMTTTTTTTKVDSSKKK
jgi:hypothetical protein